MKVVKYKCPCCNKDIEDEKDMYFTQKRRKVCFKCSAKLDYDFQVRKNSMDAKWLTFMEEKRK